MYLWRNPIWESMAFVNRSRNTSPFSALGPKNQAPTDAHCFCLSTTWSPLVNTSLCCEYIGAFDKRARLVAVLQSSSRAELLLRLNILPWGKKNNIIRIMVMIIIIIIHTDRGLSANEPNNSDRGSCQPVLQAYTTVESVPSDRSTSTKVFNFFKTHVNYWAAHGQAQL